MKLKKLKPCKRKKCPYYSTYYSNCDKCDWNPDGVWTEYKKHKG